MLILTVIFSTLCQAFLLTLITSTKPFINQYRYLFAQCDAFTICTRCRRRRFWCFRLNERLERDILFLTTDLSASVSTSFSLHFLAELWKRRRRPWQQWIGRRSTPPILKHSSHSIRSPVSQIIMDDVLRIFGHRWSNRLLRISTNAVV